LLPPPRTVLGALARGVGIILGVPSGEEKLREEIIRNVLTYTFEAYSFATIRPLSPLVKSSQILRYVPPVEKDEHIKMPQEAHDAFKTDIIFSNEIEVIFFINIESVNNIFQEYGLSRIDAEKICYAMQLIDRVGPTEAMCYTKNVEQLKIKEVCSAINTYVPYGWLEEAKGEYCIGELLPNLGVLESLGQIRQINIKNIQDKDIRRKKILYLLPLRLTKGPKGKEVFEVSEVKVKLKSGYLAYLLNDGTKVAIPTSEEISDFCR
jgi:CRISPR-associated protein Cas5 subtype I-A